MWIIYWHETFTGPQCFRRFSVTPNAVKHVANIFSKRDAFATWCAWLIMILQWEWPYRSVLVCFLRYSQPGTWELYLGLHTQRKIGSSVVKKNLKQIIPHPNYNEYTFDNDIALMELDSPVTFSDYIQPICLPSSTHNFPTGNTVWITGWGATREGGEFSLFQR